MREVDGSTADFPVPEQEADRLRALHDLEILGSPGLPALDNLCELARDIFDVPVALVSLVDAERQWFKARRGTDIECTDRGAAFCAHTILSSDLLVVPDATADPRFAASPLVTGEPGVRFYAGAPLSTVPGLQVGALCLVDFVPREFGPRQRGELVRLAEAVVQQLKFQELQARSRRQESQRALAESLTHSGCWERDLETDALLWSDGLYQLFDLDPATTAPGLEAILTRVHEADREWLVESVSRAMASKQPYELKCRIVRADGEVRWIYACAHVVRDENQIPRRSIGTVFDITDRVRGAEELASREQRYRALTEASSNIFWRSTAGGMLQEGWGWTEFTGQPVAKAMGTGWLRLVHPEDISHVLDKIAEANRRGGVYECEHRLLSRSGEYRWVLGRSVPIENPDGTIREWVGTISDIHERRDNAEKLHRSRERLKLALDAGGMVAWELDPTTGALIQSGRVTEVYGFESDNYVAYADRINRDDIDAVRAAMAEAAPGSMARAECRFLRPDGKTVWLEFRCVRFAPANQGRIVGVTFDITQRKEAEARVWYAANHDSLTGLPNRAFFNARLEELLLDTGREDGSAALFVMDVDDFKGINDTLGHDAGDRLLEEIAKRLRSMLREKDLVARLGGDEFAMLVPGIADRGDVAALGRRILNQMRRPFDYYERTVVIRASLGIALYPDHDRIPAELMKDADMALYSAKAEGRNRSVFYSPEMRRAIERRVRTAGEIRMALDRGEIVPYYQPKVCLATGRIDGFEALARWRHPGRGLLSPSAFASAFEDRELSSAIGESMIRSVITNVREWRRHGVPAFRIAVNLSAAELGDADLAGRLLGMLAEADIRPEMLEVEITESVVFGPDADLVEATLQQLHQAGVTTALDDFGTGHASLTHLKQFPIDYIKIDRSFIRDVLDDTDDAAIVSAVIGLGKNLGMKLIAEGVETAAQADFLVARGCDFGQGYLFARPMPAEDVPSFTAAHRLDAQAELLFFPPRSVA